MEFKVDSILHELCFPTPELTSKLSTSLQTLFGRSVQTAQKSFGPFDELIVDGLDHESVWEEIQSRNQPLNKYLYNKVNTIFKNLENSNADSHNILKSASNEGVDDDEVENYNSDDGDDADGDDYDDDDDDSDDAVDDGDDVGDDANLEIPPLTEEEEADMEEHLDQLERDEMARESKLERKMLLGKGHKGVLEVRTSRRGSATDILLCV